MVKRKAKKLQFIEELIELSDICMTHIPRQRKDGSWYDPPCNCRENMKLALTPLTSPLKAVVSHLRDWRRDNNLGVSPQMIMIIDECEKALCLVEGRRFRRFTP
jgi:hypothetical protein